MYRQDGFVTGGTALAAGVFFLLVGVFGFDLFSEEESDTRLSIESAEKEFLVGQQAVFGVYVSTVSPFNAIEATLSFPLKRAKIIAVDFEDSVIDLWVEEPTFDPEKGEVSFIGGSTARGGIVGKSKIASITLEFETSGKMKATFAHSLVLASDGLGTDLESVVVDSDFIVSELEKASNTNVVKREQKEEYVIKAPAPKGMDLNRDGKTTLSDLSIFLSEPEEENEEYEKEKDFNNDGSVNLKDLSILMSKIIAE